MPNTPPFSLFSAFLLLTLSLTSLTLTAARPSEITFSPRSPPPRHITVRHYTLNITSTILWQSCDPFGATTVVNATLPGPTLRARAGEILQIRVYNSLSPDAEDANGGNVTMHFHGLAMRMHPVMDGTMMVSQWPVRPGRWFDYRIPLTAEDKGTYFYHSHVGVQAMTAYGALVVEDPVGVYVDPSDADAEAATEGRVKFVHVDGDAGLARKGKSGKESPYAYDEDRVLAVGDWFSYSSTALVQNQLRADPFVWPGSATKLLLNGQSSPSTTTPPPCNQTRADPIGIQCSTAPAHCDTPPAYPTIHLDYDKTYRLRLIGATSLMYVSLAILQPTATPYTSANASDSKARQPVGMENMTLIEADGTYLDALEVDRVELTTGQRYSVLYKSRTRAQVSGDGTGGVYWMRVESRWRAGPSMWVKLVYPSSSSTASTASPPLKLFPGQKDVQLLPAETFGWVTSQLAPLSRASGPEWWYAAPMPSDEQVTRTVVIDTQQVKFYPSGKGVKWDEDGTVFDEPAPPTAQPYLVRTFLGDIQFPTPSQFQSALYNPTTYSYAGSSTSSNAAPQEIIDLGDKAEVAAAKKRKWAQGYDSALNMYFAQADEVIDIVLVNKPSAISSNVEIHPWHMHSHKHFTRTTQPGTFSFRHLDALYSSASSSFAHPIQRDTTVAYANPGAAFLNQTVPNPTTDDGGWTVLRYKVDKENAGVFLLHCHIQFHLEMGMATVWTVAPDVLANRTGMYWPTEGRGGTKTIEGLDDGYLEYGKSVSAVL
ncbi:related to L-ascorbate oxidase precursor [Sporisorium reilianum SRZ2]|uniref:laccase n=1 Tax=Sporisorium reilianum (strain SRZ2) TaxID=999809 RepID=E6ZRV3_SPORE|nr:related to L-ascorbate oxidase precursor [Sporisorium reilianum SRZ2]